MTGLALACDRAEQRLDQRCHADDAVDEGAARPEPGVGRDLVVAAARSVKSTGGCADALGQLASTRLWMSS